jgi:hypothetical protein
MSFPYLVVGLWLPAGYITHPGYRVPAYAHVLQVERGVANKGDEVEILGLGTSLRTTLTGIGEFPCNYEVSVN